MLVGQFKSKIGEKKRVAFPKKFRDELGVQLIVTRGYEGCIVVVDRIHWEKITSTITEGSFIDGKIRDASRFLLAGANEIELDAQGRFVIPDSLWEYAGFTLEDDSVFIGLVNWVELWPGPKWEEKESDVKKNSENIAQEIAEIMGKKQLEQ